MKKILFILLFLVLVSFTTTTRHSKSVLITPESELHINGTSNVTDFKCQYNIEKLGRPIRIDYHEENGVMKFEKSKLVLENNGFDCGGRGINKDFHGLLKSDVYPKIILRLKEITLKTHTPNAADALVEIEIAGISHTYTMEATYHKNENWLISGQLKLNIQDYELKAPKKMLGLIVVSENIEISFNLVIQEC